MGGKTSTSTQSTTVPPQVLAAYSAVNARANQTANTPFSQYGGEFVAPVNQQQGLGIANINTSANEAQPYFGAATSDINSAQAGTAPVNKSALGLAGQSAEAVNPTNLDANAINKYMNPYLNTVLGSTSALLNQNNQQQMSGELGNAITSGAFGGDRTGLAAANLEQQQNLANANIYSGIASNAYENALQTAQQQQGVGLGAAQANRAALASAGNELAGIGQTAYGEGANTATTLAGLGAGAQSAGLQGASAQLGAGTVQQQTQQAQDTALYNQFLQQQSYPFQVDQFLANIAEGTGALSGSTTTTQQPGGFFSDDRLKDDKKVIGKTFDGQNIYSYKMKGDPRTRIGLIAQEVEKKHPDAVGLGAGHYRMVNYGDATEEAANKGHFYSGGVVPFRPRKTVGGTLTDNDMASIVNAHGAMYANGETGGVTPSMPRGGMARVPAGNLPVGGLMSAHGSLPQQTSPMQNATALAQGVNAYGKLYNDFKPRSSGVAASSPPVQSTTTTATPGGLSPSDNGPGGLQNGISDDTQMVYPESQRRGGRTGLARGGSPYSMDSDPTELNIPDENAHNQPIKAPDLPKQSPTGFQQLMQMGQGMGGMGSMMGGMFGGGAGGAGGAASGAADAGSAAGDASAIGDLGAGFDDGGAVDAASKPGSANLGDAPDASVMTSPALKQGAPNTSLDSLKHLALGVGEAYLGNYPGAAMQFYDTYQSAKTNNARGGVAGGRKGYDAGGSPDPDMPEIQVESQKPAEEAVDAGTMAAPQADLSTPPPAAAPIDKPSMWEKIKDSPLGKPENLVPLLTAISAMGTAPTRSLGVALSAGLGAGAQSYLGTRQSLANSAQTQAETRGINIANEMAKLKVGAAQDYLNPGKPTGQTPMNKPDANQDKDQPQTPEDYYRNKFWVNPAYTPDEQERRDKALPAAGFLGNKGIADQTAFDHEQRVASQVVQNQKAAQSISDNATQAYYDSLKSGDAVGAAVAARHVNALHQWTGDKYENGMNSRTGVAQIGDISQTLSPQQQIALRERLAQPVDYGAAAKVPLGKFAQSQGMPITAPSSPSPGGGSAPAQPPAGGGSAQARTAKPAAKGDPFPDAPMKPVWADNPGHVFSEDEKPLALKYGNTKAELQDEAGKLRNTQQEQVMTRRIINELPNARTGPGSEALSDIQTVLGNLTGSEFINLVNSNPGAHNILLKSMSKDALNDTLQEIRNRGAQVRLGTQESNLIINRLSPSMQMNKTAIAGLMNWRMQQLNYEADRQNAINDYLGHGHDAMQFENYYANKVPLQSKVSTAAPAGTTIGGKTKTIDGKTYVQRGNKWYPQ